MKSSVLAGVRNQRARSPKPRPCNRPGAADSKGMLAWNDRLKNPLILLAISTALLGVIVGLAVRFPERSQASVPASAPVMLWAWERPEDFSFLEPEEAGVAFLMATTQLSGKQFEVRPRRQPLVLPPGTELEAVVRIESAFPDPVEFTPSLCRRLAGEITSLADQLGVDKLQVDFDARFSERDGYRRILEQLRRLWPAPRTLSMTALASWTLYDDWISDLPVDWAVPMFFQMGPERDMVGRYLASGRAVRAETARSTWGVSTDELGYPPPPGIRVYAFHPRPWTRSAFEELTRWLAN